ncbi:MAG: N-acetylmuramidase domain-containing protein [Alsobacter sp.]
MSFVAIAESAQRAAIRATLGARIRAKAARADNAEWIAEIVNLKAASTASLQPEDFKQAAADWKCDPATLHALADAESSGSGYDHRGRVLILAEPHVFSFNTKHAFDLTHPYLSYPSWIRYSSSAPAPRGWDRHPYSYSADDRWGLFARWAELDPVGACCAVSAGRFQQLVGPTKLSPQGGWIALQFESPEALLRKLWRSEVDQLEVLYRYLTVHGLMRAFRARDWRAIARGYNGSGQVDVYATRMADAYRKRARLYA